MRQCSFPRCVMCTVVNDAHDCMGPRPSGILQWTERRFCLDLVARVQEIAREKGCTPAQLALAWVLARGEDVVPIPGTKRRRYLEENAGALQVELSADDLARVDAGAARGGAAGGRYPPHALQAVNR